MADTPAEKSLRRVLLVSAMHGWGVAVVAGLCTALSLAMGEWLGFAVGAIITTAGVFELRGHYRLADGNIRGLDWMIRAQAAILITIWLYCLSNLLAYDEAAMMAEISPELRDLMTQAGIALSDLQALMKPVYYGTYLTVIAVSLLFQGGIALFYATRRAKIVVALDARATPPAPPPLPGV